jgi:hypothetical protein
MKTLKMGFIVIGICLCAGAAYADAISIVEDSNIYQQTENSPCVIGNPSCKQPDGFSYYNQQGPVTFSDIPTSTWILNSPLYHVDSAAYSGGVGDTNVIPSTFLLGIDVNFSPGKEQEYLEYFYVYILPEPPYPPGEPSPFPGEGGITAPYVDTGDGPAILHSSYTGPYELDVTSGNGYSDVELEGFSLPEEAYVYFQASMSHEAAGFGQFFIIPEGTTPVPEPTTLILLGLGLAGVAYLSRKRK